MAQLAPTTFTVGADESLAAVDVYSQAGVEILNSYKANVLSSSSAMDMMVPKSTPLSVLGSEISGIKVAATGATSVNPNSLMKTLVAANPSLMGALKSLAPALQGKLTMGNLQNTIMASIGGIASVVRSADLSTVTGIAKMVTGLAGATIPLAFKDLTGLSTIGVNLIKQSATMGLSGVFSAFASSSAFGGPLLNSMAISLVPMLLAKSNNKLLKEIANSAAAPYVKAFNPGFVQSYLKNWKKEVRQMVRNVKAIPGLMKKQMTTLKKEWSLMVAAFTKIDPKWNKSTKPTGATRMNGNVVVAASADTKAAVAASSKTTVIAAPRKPTAPLRTNTAGKATDTAFLNLAALVAASPASAKKATAPKSPAVTAMA